jgi:methionyl-tRNA formyltransferase
MSTNSRKIKKVILLGRKPGAAKALLFLLKNKVEVPLVVANKEEKYDFNLKDIAKKNKIRVIYNDNDLYNLIKKNKLVENVDLVISYLYWRKIKEPLIKLGKVGCINFHPAPLPDYKGRAGYNTAILDRKNWFGVSAHFIDSENFDVGPIIEVLKFPLDIKHETALSLEKKSQDKLLVLFEKVLNKFFVGKTIKIQPNKGGLYLNKFQLEELKEIKESDDGETINRKIRAFFFPPYSGAKIKLKGQEFTLVNQEILNQLREYLDKL